MSDMLELLAGDANQEAAQASIAIPSFVGSEVPSGHKKRAPEGLLI
jgi:hypothetical protein